MAAVLIIGALTLSPSYQPWETSSFACVICGERGLADFILNVLLFAPLGAALAYAGIRPRWCVLAGTLYSAAIELAQLWIPGRDSSLGDVLSNSLGALLGVVLLVSWRRWLLPGPRAARRLAAGWTIAAALTAWATVLLLQPSYPDSIYYGQWTHNLGYLAWYRGRVLAAEVGTLAVPDGQAADSRLLRAQLERGRPIVVQAVAGPPVTRLGDLFAITDDRQRGIVLVGPDRDDLVYRFRTRAELLRLDSPEVRAYGLLRGLRPGDSLRVVVTRDHHKICLSANGRRVCHRTPSPEGGWTLLVSGMVSNVHSPAWIVTALNAGWLIFLTLPIAYWGWRSVSWRTDPS